MHPDIGVSRVLYLSIIAGQAVNFELFGVCFIRFGKHFIAALCVRLRGLT